MIHINYHNITHDDQNNGDGLRVVLWLSGCSHYCYNCQNPQTWDPNGGIPYDETAENEIFKELSKEYISGITLTGGDPLHENNLDEVLHLVKQIRNLYPAKTIWLYTGYTWEYIVNDSVGHDENGLFFFLEEDKKRFQIISNVDVLIDGEYIEEQRDITLPWRGSKNQRVIDVKQSFAQNKIVLYCD